MIANGTTYPEDLPLEACQILETHRIARQFRGCHPELRLKVTYNWDGHIETESGYVGRSTGRIKIALLPHNRRSMGHHGLMRGIVRIEYANKKYGGVLWEKH